MFDLNEPPTGEEEDNDGVVCSLPQKALPLENHHPSNVLAVSAPSQGLLNNNAFSHASSVSGFQPFIRNKANGSESTELDQKRVGEQDQWVGSLSKTSEVEEARLPARLVSDVADGLVEREEGEWSDGEGRTSAKGPGFLHESESVQRPGSLCEQGKSDQGPGCLHEEGEVLGGQEIIGCGENTSCNGKIPHGARANDISNTFTGLDLRSNDSKSNNDSNLDVVAKQDSFFNAKEEPNTVLKQKEVKGIEASYALKCANNPGKRKIDQHKEAMLGKKRNRQTMFLNLEDVKLAASMKNLTPRKNLSSSATTRSVREVRGGPTPAERIAEKPNQLPFTDQKRADVSASEAGPSVENGYFRPDFNGDSDAGLLGKPKRQGNDVDLPSGVSLAPIPRQNSWKHPLDMRLPKNSQVSNKKPGSINQCSLDPKLGGKKHVPSKKQTAINTSYQDTSVERLIREVTNEKFWHHPGEYFGMIIFTTSYH